MGNEIEHNRTRLRCPEPRLDPPEEPEPLRISVERAGYQLLWAHIGDVLDAEPKKLERKRIIANLLRAIYRIQGSAEVTLTRDEEEQLLSGKGEFYDFE